MRVKYEGFLEPLQKSARPGLTMLRTGAAICHFVVDDPAPILAAPPAGFNSVSIARPQETRRRTRRNSRARRPRPHVFAAECVLSATTAGVNSCRGLCVMVLLAP